MVTTAFLLATAALFFQGLFHPLLPLLAFAPALAFFTLRCSLIKTLSLSALSGALIDLLSDDPMGIHALNYVLTTALLYRSKKHFLSEEPLHLSLFTALVSFLSTAIQLFLLFLFDRRVPFHGKWIAADLFGMPVIDALYAFVWFAAPLALFEKLRRIWVLFWLRRKNLSPTSH